MNPNTPTLAELIRICNQWPDILERLAYLEEKLAGESLPDRGGYDFAVRVLERTGRPLKKQTLYGKVCGNKIPHYHQGDTVMFNREDLELWDQWGRPGSVEFENLKNKQT